ncbi:hypothetical protein HMPREF3038_02870 [Akkermansia sp. KLE1797]|nr:hypothetical protein HMPREF3038_02870 [Akkermansia sp. KLE1797]KXU52658.1 hypothetical protein HMPREF3039_03183 [Akkermansia sp. KLE1798]KZA04086.1 hypothetical protein HMPREF1326_02284 [Akkermansia sp. KLE1605]
MGLPYPFCTSAQSKSPENAIFQMLRFTLFRSSGIRPAPPHQ